MRYDPDHKRQTRETLVKEAAKAIRKEGPHNMSLSGVMASAGLTNGGFYAHFKSRDDLLAAGIQHMFEQSRAGAQLASGPPREGLTAFIDFYLSPAHRDANTYGCPLPVLSAEAARLPRPATKRLAAGVAKLTDMLAAKLDEYDVAHADEEAAALLAQLVGALTLARAEHDADASDLILKRSRATIGRRFDLDLPPLPKPSQKQ